MKIHGNGYGKFFVHIYTFSSLKVNCCLVKGDEGYTGPLNGSILLVMEKNYANILTVGVSTASG